MSVFLIFWASWRVLPLSHSVARLELAIAEPHPKVLNLASTIVSFCTLIWSFITSPHSGAHSFLIFLKAPHVPGVVVVINNFFTVGHGHSSFVFSLFSGPPTERISNRRLPLPFHRGGTFLVVWLLFQ